MLVIFKCVVGGCIRWADSWKRHLNSPSGLTPTPLNQHNTPKLLSD